MELGAHEAVHRQDGILPSRSRLLAQEEAGPCRALQPHGAWEWSRDPRVSLPVGIGLSAHTGAGGSPRPSAVCHSGQRARRAGQGPARQWRWQGPKRLAVPGDAVPGDRAAGCHPCAVCAQGCPLLRAPGRAHRRAQPAVNSCEQQCARSQTRGAPQAPSLRHFPTPGWTQLPCSPPRPALTFAQIPQGSPWGRYKERAQGCPRLTEPGAGEWGHPW